MQWFFLRKKTQTFYVGLFWVLLAKILIWTLRPEALDHWLDWLLHVFGVLLMIGVQLLLWRFYYFFRDPERTVPEGSHIVAPADGYVVYVRRVEQGQVPLAIKGERLIPLSEVLKLNPELTSGTLIGIFMTPLSVHVNRSPIDGKIVSRAYFEGTSLRSMMSLCMRSLKRQFPIEAGADHILENERETLQIHGAFPIYVTRIADPYVKHIEFWKTEGESVAMGERFGMIRMGSQTDIFIPDTTATTHLQVQVEEGAYVYAGSTILAKIPQNNPA